MFEPTQIGATFRAKPLVAGTIQLLENRIELLAFEHHVPPRLDQPIDQLIREPISQIPLKGLGSTILKTLDRHGGLDILALLRGRVANLMTPSQPTGPQSRHHQQQLHCHIPLSHDRPPRKLTIQNHRLNADLQMPSAQTKTDRKHVKLVSANPRRHVQ